MSTKAVRRCWPLPSVELVDLESTRERRPAILVTTPGAAEAAAARLRLDPLLRLDVDEATLEHWLTLAGRAGEGEARRAEAVWAVGGGLAVDAAKVIARERGLPLVSVPTALSVDAFFTWAAGHRLDGCVRYLETGPPERVLLDLDLLGAAPPPIRAAGLCDLLSIATGTLDWRLAEERGKNPPDQRFLPWAAECAEGLLRSALDCAAAAGRGEPAGLEQLAHALALEVQLCNLIGHSRPEEGSEHHFAYALEERLAGSADGGHAHGDLVGPGIVLLAGLQRQPERRRAELREALVAGGVPLALERSPAARDTLIGLPEYCRRHRLPWGCGHELDGDEVETLFA